MLLQCVTVVRIGESELNKRLEVTIVVSDVESSFVFRQAHADALCTFLQENPNRVGQLNFASFARLCPFQSRAKEAKFNLSLIHI